GPSQEYRPRAQSRHRIDSRLFRYRGERCPDKIGYLQSDARHDQHNALLAAEKALGDLSERMLAGVAARFGKNSSYYEQAGGVRMSERKRPVRKPKAPPTKP